MLQFAEVTAGKVDNFATIRTDQMMVVLWRSDYVAAAATSGMHLTYKPKFGEYLEGTIDSEQPNAGMLLTYPVIYRGRGKMILT